MVELVTIDLQEGLALTALRLPNTSLIIDHKA